MDAETLAHWHAADALFDQWLDLAEGERDAWLAAQDLSAAVRHRLEQLVAAHRHPRAALDPLAGSLAGRRLGDWILDTELGRGGMAVVYRAWREQGMARQQAAIKVLTLGALGASGRDRFQREAAILAHLNHPNVTALIDSGVADDGTCWLAMPLVDGERIDRWCESNSPDAHAIVRRYLQVCDAIAYAHRNLVIHRDLKPSNVLVDADGHVRLLDFGIGQFTDSADERTQTMWRALTPGYAAPEQLRGALPSTAIDIYGLGALLHRLLTGRTPQAATEGTDTTRPSLLVRATDDAYHRHYVPLKNDLDRVLLKALAEEPEQRYATAEALADDLRRWLDGRPVLAQEPKLGYRLRKFVARNKLGVAAACLLFATVGAGITTTLWQAQKAQKEAKNARIQAQRAVLVRDFLQQVFASTLPSAGEVPTALDLLDEGSTRARSSILADDPLAAADILTLTGTARMKLSRYEQAEGDLRAALELLGKHGATAIPEQMRVHEELAEVYWNTGKQKLAVEHARKAVALGEAHDDVPARKRFNARLALAMATTFLDPGAAEAMSRELLDDAIAAGFGDTDLHRNILDGLASAMVQMDRDRASILPLLEESLRLTRLLDGEMSGWHAYALANSSATFFLAGKIDRAHEMLQRAAKIAGSVYDEPHQTTAVIECQLATHLHLRGRREEASKHYDAGAEIDRAIGRENLHAAECARYRAILRASLGQYPGALEDLDRSHSLRVLNEQLETPTTRSICGLRASIHVRLGDMGRARQTLDQCPASAGAGDSLYFSLAKAEVLIAQGKPREAAERADALRRANGRRSPDNNWMRPWMLSMLLARRAGDSAAETALVSEAADFAQLPPAASCFTDPTEANCLALP